MNSPTTAHRLTILFSILFLAPLARAQNAQIQLFSDKQDLRRTFASLPAKEDGSIGDRTILNAYVNRGLGAQFNRPVSLTTVFCDENAIDEIKLTIKSFLNTQQYDTSADWDKFGNLRVRKSTRATIFKAPAEVEEIFLRVKIDQTTFDERAITVDYEVRAGSRLNDPSSMTDRSSSDLVRKYMDALCDQIRSKAESVLREHCAKATLKDIDTVDQAVMDVSQRLHLNAKQREALRAALRSDE